MLTNDDCIKCGACCAYFFDEDLSGTGHRGVGLYISNDEVSQIPPSVRRLLVVEFPIGSSHDRWLRGRKVGDHYQCKALDGEMGDCKCAIYEYRPETCRAFKPGSVGCLMARAEFGFPLTKEGPISKANANGKRVCPIECPGYEAAQARITKAQIKAAPDHVMAGLPDNATLYRCGYCSLVWLETVAGEAKPVGWDDMHNFPFKLTNS